MRVSSSLFRRLAFSDPSQIRRFAFVRSAEASQLALPASAFRTGFVRFLLVPKKYMVGNLPEWGKDRRVPRIARILTVLTAAPIVLGGLLLHLLPLLDENAPITVKESRGRDVLSFTFYYASMVLAFQGAVHWGMQLAEFGLPRYAETQSMYYFSR